MPSSDLEMTDKVTAIVSQVSSSGTSTSKRQSVCWDTATLPPSGPSASEQSGGVKKRPANTTVGVENVQGFKKHTPQQWRNKYVAPAWDSTNVLVFLLGNSREGLLPRFWRVKCGWAAGSGPRDKRPVSQKEQPAPGVRASPLTTMLPRRAGV